MANTVIALKKSGTPSAVPSSLTFGELAINYADGVLYYKAANGTILPFTTETNSFGTINANGTLIVSDTTSDVFSLVPGDFINITGDGINDSITISANVKPLFDKVNAAAKVTMSNTAPVSPGSGDFWWNSDLGRLLIYYNDGDTSQWVDATAMLGPDYGLVYDVANAAFDQANTSVAAGLSLVYDTANAAFIHANAAFAYANTISSDADEKANAAIITANAAFDRANSANSLVYDLANTVAISTGNINFVNAEASAAFTTANLGFNAANSAFGAANAAFAKANANNGIGNSTSGQVLFNDTGISNGSSNLTFNKTTGTLNVVNINITGTASYISANSILIGDSEVNSIILITSTTNDQIIDSFANNTWRSAHYKITMNAGTDFQTTQVSLLQDGFNAYITEYASIANANTLGVFSATVTSGSVRLNIAPTFSTTTIRMFRTATR